MTLHEALALQAVTAAAYTALIIVASLSPESALGVLVLNWVHASRDFVDAVLLLAPIPPQPDQSRLLRFDSNGALFYRHILVFCLVIAMGSLLAFRVHWSRWAQELGKRLCRLKWPRSRVETLLVVGRHQMMLGAVAVLIFLLFGDVVLVRHFPNLYESRWLYLRAPALTSLWFAFVCHAAIFARFRR